MLNKLIGNFAKRHVPKRGPLSSEDYNNTFDELLADFNSLITQWNNSLQPLIDSLPNGGTLIAYEDRTSEIDPFVNGFDGSQFYMDLVASDELDEGYYYDSTNKRPLTVKESFSKLREELQASIEVVSNQVGLIDAATGLTVRQKQRIGLNIFDEEEASSGDSLDGLIVSALKRLNQLAADIWNDDGEIGDQPGYLFGSTGTQTKGNGTTIVDLISNLQAQITDLLDDMIPQIRVLSTDGLSTLVSDLTTIRANISTNTSNISALVGSLGFTSPSVIGWNPGRHHFTDLENMRPAVEALDEDLDTAETAFDDLITILGFVSETNIGWVAPINFLASDDLRTAIQSLDIVLDGALGDIGVLQTDVGTLQGEMVAAQADILALETDVFDLEAEVTIIDSTVDTLVATSNYIIANCLPYQELDGIRSTFSFARPVLHEEIPLIGGGYPFVQGVMTIFELERSPLGYDTTGIQQWPHRFTNTNLFTTDTYPNFPVNDGEYIVIDEELGSISGYSVGNVIVVPGETTSSPGTISYYTELTAKPLNRTISALYTLVTNEGNFRSYRLNPFSDFSTNSTDGEKADSVNILLLSDVGAPMELARPGTDMSDYVIIKSNLTFDLAIDVADIGLL